VRLRFAPPLLAFGWLRNGGCGIRLVLKGDVRVPRQGKRQFPAIKSCRVASLSLPTAIVHLKLILPLDRNYSVGG
jgi:hypothetical protein